MSCTDHGDGASKDGTAVSQRAKVVGGGLAVEVDPDTIRVRVGQQLFDVGERLRCSVGPLGSPQEGPLRSVGEVREQRAECDTNERSGD